MENKRFWKGYICGILSIVGILAVLVLFKQWTLPESLTVRQETEVLLKLNQMSSLIGSKYLEDVDKDALLEGAYAGFAKAVGDKYTRYYTPEEFEAYLEDASGTFTGIGVIVQWNEEQQMLEILSVVEGGPAEKAGLQAGDLVFSVDGEEMKDTSMEIVIGRVRGKAGTDVVVGVLREGEEDLLLLTVTRERIEEDTVASMMLDDGIGYIQISEFDDITPKQFKEALETLQEQNMKGLILDLRGNPGGRLSAVVDIADQMVPEGIVTYTLTRDGTREEYTSDGETQVSIPLVTLVDENSASASEILAGALHDYQMGTLIGIRTFGKGIVQTTYSLSDGSGIKVTMARYFTPNGDFIHGVGIEPDMEVALPEGKTLGEVLGTESDTQYAAAVREIHRLIEE
ncbi:MAG: PDZ domain-containing protein [Clostridiales bacterium]|nr:PDZ domain-containing protein [Clostridiales bacterium]